MIFLSQTGFTASSLLQVFGTFCVVRGQVALELFQRFKDCLYTCSVVHSFELPVTLNYYYSLGQEQMGSCACL